MRTTPTPTRPKRSPRRATRSAARTTRKPQGARRPEGLPPCHPERRARSARSRRTPPVAEARGGAEAPRPGCARVFRPAAPKELESTSDLRKSGGQGSMGKNAHRPCCLWFVYLRVRLTKPPQIAMLPGWGSTAPAGARIPQARPGPQRFAQVSCGWPRVGRALTCGRLAGCAACEAHRRRALVHIFCGSLQPRRQNRRSCTFFAVRCSFAPPRPCPPRGRFRKTAGQSNGDAVCHPLDGRRSGPTPLLGARKGVQSCNETQKMCTNGLPADAGAPRRAQADSVRTARPPQIGRRRASCECLLRAKRGFAARKHASAATTRAWRPGTKDRPARAGPCGPRTLESRGQKGADFPRFPALSR